jgi:hypothetical protein
MVSIPEPVAGAGQGGLRRGRAIDERVGAQAGIELIAGYPLRLPLSQERAPLAPIPRAHEIVGEIEGLHRLHLDLGELDRRGSGLETDPAAGGRVPVGRRHDLPIVHHRHPPPPPLQGKGHPLLRGGGTGPFRQSIPPSGHHCDDPDLPVADLDQPVVLGIAVIEENPGLAARRPGHHPLPPAGQAIFLRGILFHQVQGQGFLGLDGQAEAEQQGQAPPHLPAAGAPDSGEIGHPRWAHENLLASKGFAASGSRSVSHILRLAGSFTAPLDPPCREKLLPSTRSRVAPGCAACRSRRCRSR